MNPEQLAFFNQQLSGMLRSGIPLEGALVRLTREMSRGGLKEEIEALAEDLSKGTDLALAVEKRRFPSLYRMLLIVGARAGRLEDILVLVADHYQRCSIIEARLRSMVFYPLLILTAAFLLSLLLSVGSVRILETFRYPAGDPEVPVHLSLFLYLAPVLLGVLWLGGMGLTAVSPLRRLARWRLPGMRDGSLSLTASAMAALLQSGIPLSEALAVVRDLEPHHRTGRELDGWRRRLSAGRTLIADIAVPSRSFPPLFIWLVASSGEALAEGFEKAASLYQQRARHRAELILAAFLPASILGVGGLVLLQLAPVFLLVSRSMRDLMSF